MLIGFHALRAVPSPRAPFLWLLAASAIFYAWPYPPHLALLALSILLNFGVAVALTRTARPGVLVAGVVGNVLLLATFKYTPVSPLVPLGISFITFQQIAYLVDTYRGDVERHDLRDLALVVALFPHLIAGPILRYQDIAPQLNAPSRRPLNDLAVGATLFVVGLVKKVLLADGLAVYVAAVFDGAAVRGPVSWGDAWAGALAYALQLYFDFSGYCDMALGIARMVGLRLPLNFRSPYKATSIVEFWRRWHITLSRFLFEDLYFPLAARWASRAGRYAALVVIMVVAGVWHGLGATFLVWGALHGVYLVINHAWREWRRGRATSAPARAWTRPLATLVTFTAVVVAWVFFRASSLDAALAIVRGMAGLDGGGIGLRAFGAVEGASARRGLATIAVLLGLVWFTPSSQEWLAASEPALDPVSGPRWQWRPSAAWGAVVGVLAAVCLYLMLSRKIEFLYFQF